MFEFIEHTADTGLRVRAATREELFAEAARALYALLLENPADVRPAERHEITLAAGDGADLLHDWLDELLFQYSARRLIFVQFQLNWRKMDSGQRFGESRWIPSATGPASTSRPSLITSCASNAPAANGWPRSSWTFSVIAKNEYALNRLRARARA
jgi:hypothetical protein